MKAYNLEIWSRDFRIVEYGEVINADYSIDYLAYGKNKVERFATKASYGDYVRITGNTDEVYSGIINSITGENNKKKISKILVAPFYAIFFVGSRIEKWGLTLITSIAFSFAVPYILGWFVPAIYRLLR